MCPRRDDASPRDELSISRVAPAPQTTAAAIGAYGEIGGGGVVATVALPAAVPHPTGVPRVGDLYWLNTATCYGKDKKVRRPAVVVRGPNPPLLTDVVVIARTSDVNAVGVGVAHAGVVGTPLDRAGKFMKRWRHNIDARLFAMPAYTSYAGELDSATLHDVLKMMGLE